MISKRISVYHMAEALRKRQIRRVEMTNEIEIIEAEAQAYVAELGNQISVGSAMHEMAALFDIAGSFEGQTHDRANSASHVALLMLSDVADELAQALDEEDDEAKAFGIIDEVLGRVADALDLPKPRALASLADEDEGSGRASVALQLVTLAFERAGLAEILESRRDEDEDAE
jgi:hypothetical protein